MRHIRCLVAFAGNKEVSEPAMLRWPWLNTAKSVVFLSGVAGSFGGDVFAWPWFCSRRFGG